MIISNATVQNAISLCFNLSSRHRQWLAGVVIIGFGINVLCQLMRGWRGKEVA
jgi:hypothetical protein